VALVPKPVLAILEKNCAADGLTYTVTFDTLHASSVRASAGVLDGNRVKDIPQGQLLTLTAANRGCAVTDTVSMSCVQPYGSIGNHVWFDTDNDGIQDVADGELPIDGVQVDLLDGQGHVIRTTTTHSGGTYLFDSLATGTYQIWFHRLDTYQFSNIVKSEDAKNSDADRRGFTSFITINTSLPETDKGRNNPDIDAGMVCPPSLSLPISVRKVERP
jgi:hypothetical protein